MKLVILISILLSTSFHQVAENTEGVLELKLLRSNDNYLINISTPNTDCVDSLIIHTDKWRIALGRPDFTDECIFEINSAETAVLKNDYIQQFEIRVNGKSEFFNSTQGDYLRKKLLGQ